MILEIQLFVSRNSDSRMTRITMYCNSEKGCGEQLGGREGRS